MSALDLFGCDTLVAAPPATASGRVLFAKNSDRHPDECQHLRVFPAREWRAGEMVRCQYLALPQAPHTHRVLGSQPFWLWGFEHGINEHGVVIGNEAIWTKAARQAVGLLGMDLIRLGLERAATASEALEVITLLLAEHGQGGSPRHNDANAACYDNSFIIADRSEAWILETSGRDWAARRVTGIASISNVPSLGAEWDAASPALRDRPGLDFARDLGDYEAYPQTSGAARCGRSRALLQSRSGALDVPDMFAFLRDHGDDPAWAPGETDPPTICMHPGRGQTAASLVVRLDPEGFTAWCSLVTPCMSPFLPFYVNAEVPEELAVGAAEFDPASLWWRIKRLEAWAARDWPHRFPRIRAHWDAWEAELFPQADRMAGAPASEQTRWVAANVARLRRELTTLEETLDIAEDTRTLAAASG